MMKNLGLASFVSLTFASLTGIANGQAQITVQSGYVMAYAARSGTNGFFDTLGIAQLTFQGGNQWSAGVYRESLANGPYLYGGTANIILTAVTSPNYPQLFVTHSSNGHSYAQDDLAGGQTGRAWTESQVTFHTTDYAFLQLSLNYYGYLDTAGWGGGGSNWSRTVTIDEVVKSWDNTPVVAGQFEHLQETTRYFIPAGTHFVRSNSDIKSQGQFATLGGITPGRNQHQHETYNNVSNIFLPAASLWWVYPASVETRWPASYTILLGQYFGGDLSSLQASDDNSLYILNDESAPNASFFAQIPVTVVGSPFAFRINAECKSTRDDQIQYMSFLNHRTGTFERVANQFSTLVDSNQEYTTSNYDNVIKYIDLFIREVFVRLEWIPTEDIAAEDGWSSSVDEIKYRGYY